jgi:alpha-D-xyloside xylohydrolase
VKTLLITLVLLVHVVSGFPFLRASPVEVKSVEKNETGVTLQMQNGLMRLEVCGDRTIHVLYSPTGELPKVPIGFAVQKQPVPGAFEVTEAVGTVTLKAAQCSAVVDKKTGAISFLTPNGKSFLQETADGGKTLTPSTVAGSSTNMVEQKFALDPREGLYGLGQHPTGVMNYVGTTVHLQQMNMDIAVPVLVSSKGYGVFWNNPSVTDVIFSKASDPNPIVDWKSEYGSAIDYYVFYGPELDQVIADYRQLTGAAPMLGRWGYGFWQCKQRYHSQEQLLDTVARYRQMQVPIDGIIQDWLWWYPNPWGSHQFDAARYPDPAAMMKQLHDENVHLLISVWAKFDVGSDNANELNAAGALYPQVIPYAYPPGKGQWYDAFNPEARRLYWSQMSKEIFSNGVDGWWLDASEAEISGHWGEFRNFKTAAGPGAEVYNAYPLMHTTSVYEGQRAENSDKRVLILTRSAYAGQQRNAAVAWSGDIQGTWDVFKKQIPDGINFSLSGIPYWNTDTGGFFGGSPSDPKYAELFTRWFQFSAFCPMFRVHGDATADCMEPTQRDNPGKEMWQFPPETEKILIDYDKLRYHLLPYIYSVAWKVTSEGSTMMRGLVMDFQNDPQVYNIPDQYMFGPALMVNPVTGPAGTKSISIPPEQLSDKKGGEGALTGTYFQGVNFDEQKLERRDAVIDFNWDQNPPDPGMQREHFSARWEGTLLTKDAGDYAFTLSADDGMRLWVNSQLIVDDWNARPSATHTANISLPANTKVPIKIEYFQDKADATISLSWMPPGTNALAFTRPVYLPSGTSWTDFWTGRTTPGGQTVDATAPIEKLPLYVRAGSIIPYGPEVQSAMEMEDPIELRVYRGAGGSFTLYEDENDNYNYEKGAYATIPFAWDDKAGVLTIGARTGAFRGMLEKRTFRVVFVASGHGAGLHSTEQADAEIVYSGYGIAVHAPSK